MPLNDGRRSPLNNTFSEIFSQVVESQHLNVQHICLVKKEILKLKEVSGTHQSHMGGEAARRGGDAMWVGREIPSQSGEMWGKNEVTPAQGAR